jgi:hypothetical protein
MELEGSLPRSQELATSLQCQPDNHVRTLPPFVLKTVLILLAHLLLGRPCGFCVLD